MGNARGSSSGSSDIRPGDVILLNDPYHGGSHSAGRDRVRADLRRRCADCTGPSRARIKAISAAPPMAATIPTATEIWQEGLRTTADQARTRPVGSARRPPRYAGAERPQRARVPRRPRGVWWGQLISRRAAHDAVARRVRQRPWSQAAVESILDAAEQQTRAVVFDTGRTACFMARRFSTTTAAAAATSGSAAKGHQADSGMPRSISPVCDPQIDELRQFLARQYCRPRW